MSFAGLIFSSQPALALDKVTLQLKWMHSYQFAGYYAAKELGYYSAAGLEVDIKPLIPGMDLVSEVTEGRANYGTGTSGLLVARQNGAPVVALAVIFQHSPYVLIAKKFKDQQSIRDLSDRPILLRKLSDELLVYLKREKVDLRQLSDSTLGVDTLEKLQSGSVAAISGYTSYEPYELQKAGFPIVVHNPASVGIDVYGDNLFTSNSELEKNPERTERFRVASLQGWEYVLNHPEEAIAIVQKYAVNQTAQRIAYARDKIEPLIHRHLVPVGYMNEARWQQTVAIYKEGGSLNPEFSLNGFVYDTSPQKGTRALYNALTISIIVSFIFFAGAYYVWRLNRRLTSSLSQVQHLANHDSLTGLPNRALFNDRLQRAILKARREKSLFALLYIDIDRFKSINDQFGHSAGDEVLKASCNRMMACTRDSDSLGRLGGDEFAVLLEDLRSPEDALEIAKKIQSAIALGVSVGGELIDTTISVGVSIYPNDADSEEGLFKRADTAMYRSKMSGRNSISMYADTPNKE